MDNEYENALAERAQLELAAMPLLERPLYACETYSVTALGCVYLGLGFGDGESK